MNIKLMLIITVMLAGSQVLAADLTKPYHNSSKWRIKEFVISTWGTPNDEVSTKMFKDMGFNVVMSGPDMLDTLHKYNMKSLVMYVTPEIVGKIKNHPAVWGYYVIDEPWNQADYDKSAALAKSIRKVDNTKPLYINLGGTMEQHPTFLSTTKPDYLSFDYYQWWWGSVNHFSRLESYRNAALKADLPLFVWVESNADPRYEWGLAGASYLPGNLEKLRQSVYTNLAYGVKGIQWFTAVLAIAPDSAGVWKRNQAGDDIAAINAEIKPLGPILVKLTSTAVYHTPPLPDSTKLLPINYWISTNQRNVLLGLFKDDRNKNYAMVVNRDWEHPNIVKLTFDGSVTGARVFDAGSGKWRTQLLTGAEYTLREGAAVLLQIDRQ